MKLETRQITSFKQEQKSYHKQDKKKEKRCNTKDIR